MTFHTFFLSEGQLPAIFLWSLGFEGKQEMGAVSVGYSGGSIPYCNFNTNIYHLSSSALGSPYPSLFFCVLLNPIHEYVVQRRVILYFYVVGMKSTKLLVTSICW